MEYIKAAQRPNKMKIKKVILIFDIAKSGIQESDSNLYCVIFLGAVKRDPSRSEFSEKNDPPMQRYQKQ